MASTDILDGKRILITGGAGGVGRAVDARMKAAGARVLIADRDERDLRKVVDSVRSAEGGGEIDSVTSDLSDATGIARMVERIDSWLGGLDMLIACAGVGSGPLMEMAESGLALCDRKQSGATSRAPRARSRGFARRVSMTD